jgi:hypothetical protein
MPLSFIEQMSGCSENVNRFFPVNDILANDYPKFQLLQFLGIIKEQIMEMYVFYT